jgi:hypothetical protein
LVVSDLDTFRNEARDWLEANCPAEMRTSIRHDDDVCWGGRKAKLSDAQRQCLKTAAVAKGRTAQQVSKAGTMRLALWVSKGTSAI